MISEYESSPTAAAHEQRLSAEELARFARQDLPGIVEGILKELGERFGVRLGFVLLGPGGQTTALTRLPGFCRRLLCDHRTGDLCLAAHAPRQAEGRAVNPQACYAGVKYQTVTFSIAGLGQAALFGGLAPDIPSEDLNDVLASRDFDSYSADERKQLHDLFGALGSESSSMAVEAILEVSAFLLTRFFEQRIQDLARSRDESLAKQMFLHEAAHGIAAVEATLAGLEDLLRPYVDDFSPHDKEDARKFLSVLKREYQIHRMALLNLLEYYHPAAYAEMQLSVVAVCNPTDLLRDLLPLYKPLAQARNVRLDEELTNWHEMPKVRLDKAAMTRAFHNVLWNAIKYSYRSVANPAAATDRFIRVSCRPLYNPGQRGQGRECSIEVENYGLGIKGEEISRVTQATFRGEAAIREKTIGSGLGLYETERILRNHGGRLRIVSRQVHSDTYVTRVILIIPYRTTLGRGDEG